ncbi:Rrf2 family transcriptional regulator [Brevundimonas staleyi]|uniref:Rrf2 family transcriptional regulator n=1 Tax=Brevundimonas staleyi TaxID=74326 RepID=A0ABW0FNB5_9CAUL
MPTDSRLSRMLHVLIHMDRHGGPLTSETIAGMLGTNPVVVRRTMSGLKAAGYVASEKGHGGGWTVARPLDQITLLDIHEAVGSPKLFAIGLADDDPACLIERAVNAAMTETLSDAERMLRARLSEVTVASVAPDVEQFDAYLAAHTVRT